MKTLFTIIFLIITSFINDYEIIGSFKYDVKINRVFITDKEPGMMEYVKSYYRNNKFQAGCIVKAQKGQNAKPTDTVYIKGFTEIDNKNRKLICKEYYYYEHAEFLKRDSVIRIFKQQINGDLKLTSYKEYYGGALVVEK